MSHRREWEKKLRQLFHDIDRHLEQKYGDRYSLHPARKPHGKTGNPSYDGLFNVGAAYTVGYGSKLGEGYIVDVDLVTLEQVPETFQHQLEREVHDILEARLPDVFPGAKLTVEREGNHYKIIGDLSLGSI